MREEIYRNFRFTPSVTRKVLMWAVAVPVITYYIADSQDYKWDWAGKLKTDSLYRKPPVTASKENPL